MTPSSLRLELNLVKGQWLASKVANSLLVYVIWRYICLSAWRHIRARTLVGSGVELYVAVRTAVMGLLLKLPSSRKQVDKELSEARVSLETKLVPLHLPGITYQSAMNEKGRSPEWIDGELDRLKALQKGDIQEGKVSGAVYHGGDDLNAIILSATGKFITSNPLHPDLFSGVRKMEAEIVSMCLNLFNNPHGAGTTTSGGTESILMACKAARDWGRATKGITRPEMIIPSSAHAAFWKASDYFGLKLHVVPVNPLSRKANVKQMSRAINPNTILIVGSAPNFPDGTIDPISALAKVALRHKILLHVDCCLGSLLMPFLKRAGFGEGVEEGFDFAVDGVTSISCDTHKYGFCPKGSSVIMYKDATLRRYQYYIQPDWAGGVYASPSMAGSRPGSILAGAWAVMTHFGAEGYESSCRTILAATRRLKTTLLSPEFSADIYVLGDPLVSVVAFGVKVGNGLKENDIYAIGDQMGKRGWHLSALSNPPALHIAMTILTSKSVDKLLGDLRLVIDQLKSDPPDSGDMVALYGLGQSAVGPLLVSRLAETFIDTLYLTR